MGVNSRALEDVLDKVRNKHYQVSDYHLYIKLLSSTFVSVLTWTNVFIKTIWYKNLIS